MNHSSWKYYLLIVVGISFFGIVTGLAGCNQMQNNSLGNPVQPTNIEAKVVSKQMPCPTRDNDPCGCDGNTPLPCESPNPVPTAIPTPVFTPTPDVQNCMDCINAYNSTIEEDLEEDLKTLSVEILGCTVECAPAGFLGPEGYVGCVGLCSGTALAKEGFVFGGQSALALVQVQNCLADNNCPANYDN